MGDGRVSLIMDVLGLAHSAHLLTRGKDRGSGEVGPSTAARGQNERTLLVIAVGADGRAALPLDQVTRLEKVPRRLVEQSHQREVIQYRGEIMPLLRLSGHTASHGGHDPNDLMDVVVYTHGRGSVGVVVDQILDIAAGQFGSQSADGTQLPDAPPSGAIVIDGHVTDLLDLPSLVTSAML
jgi:two-component system chemotaxis sensor kinase CheA